MKHLFSILIIAVAAFHPVACTNKKQMEEQKPQKSLVLYYSQTGTTKAVAEEIQRLTSADIEAIEVEQPYDGDFGATVQRVQKERDANELPTVKPLKSNIADYDVIYLGYPIWFGTYAPPIAALVKEQDFADKTVVPFCTFGSGGVEVSVGDLKTALPKANIATEGYGVRTARVDAVPAEVERFLKENKFLEGEVETLPEFSEQAPVTDAEVAIFNEACSSYQFPLGTPITFGKRDTNDGTDYKFVVESQNPTGEKIEAVIYVIVNKEGKADFTKVVR